MDVSFCGMSPGRKLFQTSQECMETVSAYHFPVLDDQERNFARRLYPVAGVRGPDRRCDVVVPAGESRCAGWENPEGIAVIIPHARILLVRANHGTIGE